MGSWVVEMQATKSIYKVHPFISNINKTAYQPRVVSFGPYHHGEPQLAWMEAHKKRVLNRYIHQLGVPQKEIFRLVEKMAQELKESYDSLDFKWQDNTKSFVQLMMLDGCFMLELLDVYKDDNYYSDNDPVFSRHGELYVMPFVRADMLMLENQLPMSLLLSLKYIRENVKRGQPIGTLDLGSTNIVQSDIEELNKSILFFLFYDISKYSEMGTCLHVLDLYRKGLLHTHNEDRNAASQSANEGEGFYPKMGKCFYQLKLRYQRLVHTQHTPGDAAPQSANEREGFYPKMGKCFHELELCYRRLVHTQHTPGDAAPQSSNQGVRKNKGVGHNVVRPATELHEAGVRFVKSESKSLLDITFGEGTLKLPNFMISDSTESIFLNLIAFERCHNPAGSYITSFVAFMDCIIDDSLDIKLLSSKGIIDNIIGTDKEAADLFNTMSKGLVLDLNENLGQMYTDLIHYCNRRWHKWRANLTQTYFRNPWAIISVIAAFLLLSLTAVQTIFTILN
ncbi:UPF0481 protein At3g47200-like [Diospyros lotus]|uniref:UPF0481 protein At3g47200-like n=1 Tax=Diospyros lotus TaxID=55363 RepID=UPI002252FEEB|nr:UPF0481 protein At3g47200-like [Diospyros lotus]